jgi:hypothetical protein
VCGSATSSRGDVGDSQGRFYLVLRYTALHPDFEVPVKLLFVLLLAACGDTTSAPGSSSALQGPVALINPAASVAPIAAAEPIPVAAPVGQPATMSMSDLTDMSKADLRVARNEIFARHGRGFSSEDLQAHFGGQDWYHVNADYSDDMLSDAQKAQVALIASFETDRDPVENYRFSGDVNLSFADAQTVVIGDFGAVYEGSAPTFNYTTHGDWVRTWEGSFPMAADASNIAWFELNYDNSSVRRRILAADLTH